MNYLRLAATTIVMWMYLQQVRPDCFTAVVKIDRAFKDEQLLLDLGAEAFRALRNDFHEIYARYFERLITDANEDHAAAALDPQFSHHPINIYHIVKRMSHWRQVLNRTEIHEIENRQVQEFLHESVNLTTVDWWPSMTDVNGSAISLIRLRSLYNISFSDLKAGNLHSVVIGRPLSLDEVFEIAEVGVQTCEHPYYAYEPLLWLFRLLDEYNTGEKFQKYSIVDLYRWIAKGFHKFQDGAQALHYMGLARQLEPNDEILIREEEDLRVVYGDDLPDKYFGVNKHEITLRYESLCRDDIEKGNSINLACYHQRSLIPYRPADVEVVSDDPYVALMHKSIHPKEIDTVKKLALESFKRSKVLLKKNESEGLTNRRISESAWLSDDLKNPNDIIHRLSRRIEFLTGLNTELRSKKSPCEDLQVLNYGVGGMYEPHNDFYDMEAFEKYGNKASRIYGSGNRIATWMFYLNDVIAGGATVFPKLGIRIPVVKGAAAFWYNLHKNGQGDKRMLHAGCPVLIGSKWVANKWVHEIEQHFRRPCSTDPNK